MVQQMGVPEIAEADRRLTMISQDRILQMQYEQRMKAVRDDFAYFEDSRKIGKLEGRAEDILKVLAARGLALGEEARARVLSCTDLALLDRWLIRAATVSTAAEVLSDS